MTVTIPYVTNKTASSGSTGRTECVVLDHHAIVFDIHGLEDYGALASLNHSTCVCKAGFCG